MSSLLVLSVALAPFVANWIAKVVLEPRPFYVWYSDPELIFHFNGSRLLGGELPLYSDSPGTPVVVLSALVQAAVAGDPLDPRPALRVGYVLGLIATVGAAWLLLRVPLRTRAPAIQALALLIFFLSPGALARSNVWSAEIFCFAAGSLVIASAWTWSRRPESARWQALFGAALGFACSLKLTFLPWLACALVMLAWIGRRGLSSWMRFGAGFAGAFGLATAPIAHRYDDLWIWVTGLATRTGVYGGGASGFVDLESALREGQSLALSSKGWHLVIGVVLVAVTADRVRERASSIKPEPTIDDKLLIAFGVALALGYILYLKHPGVHYLIPVGLAGTAIVAAGAPRLESQMGERGYSLLAGLVLLLAVRSGHQDWESHHRRIQWGTEQTEALRRFIVEDGTSAERSRVLYGWRFPSPAFALLYFAGATADLDVVEAVRARYPNAGAFDVFQSRAWPAAEKWDYLVVDSETWAKHAREPLRSRLLREGVELGPWTVLRSP